jgi:hypothetical protein
MANARPILTCLLLIASALSQTRQPLSVADVVKGASDAVVQIVVSDSMGQEAALGSGFVISSDGKIITNYHVIKNAHSATVKLSNGSFFLVTGVVATDPDKDLAVLKVAGKNLPFLSLADSQSLKVGDHVVAIGSPLGLEGTVSDGIISALRDEGPGKSWIQTTAPVSHGNSGGPLLDLQGNVVGVITWGVNLQLGQNLNFAAPSNEVKPLVSVAQEPMPFGSMKNAQPAATAVVLDSHIWTSMTSGRDYKIRRDGDYIYTEWVNKPSQLPSTAFMRSELKKDADGRWRGKGRTYLPCEYKEAWTGRLVVKWCSLESDMEIDLLSESRIEGFSQGWDKFDCRKCEPKNRKQRPFTWIPKE